MPVLRRSVEPAAKSRHDTLYCNICFTPISGHWPRVYEFTAYVPSMLNVAPSSSHMRIGLRSMVERIRREANAALAAAA